MIKIEISKSGLAVIGKQGFREVGRIAIAAAVAYWHAKFLPLHFTNIAYIRYRFARRDNRTTKLKRDRKPWPFGDDRTPAAGEIKPLVFSGRSREQALHNNRIDAKAISFEKYRATDVLNARAFNFGVGKRIDMRDEVTRVTPQEEKTLERIFAETWERELIARGVQAPKTRRVA